MENYNSPTAGESPDAQRFRREFLSKEILKRPLNKSEIMQLLDDLSDYWTAPKNISLILWGLQMFGLRDGDTIFELSPKMNELLFFISRIQKNLKDLGLIGSDTDEQIDTEAYLNTILEKICSIHGLLEHQYRYLSAEVRNNPLPPSTRVFQYSVTSDEQLNETHQLILFLLYRLSHVHYAKRLVAEKEEPFCYEQVYVNGHATHFWKPKCSLTEFIVTTCQKEIYNEQWIKLHKHKSNIQHCIDYLSHSRDVEFPIITPDRYAFAFNNGIFYFRDAPQFYKYGEHFIPPDLVCVNYFNNDFPIEHLQIVSNGNWYDIPTPHLHSIIAYQEMGEVHEREKVIKMIYVMIGRMYFEMNTRDKWQIAPFTKGVGGSGKSTLGAFLLGMYQRQDVGVLSSNIEEKFGLANFIGKHVYVCLEMKKNFKLPLSELQSMITGDPMSIPKKFGNPIDETWTSHGWFFGNELADFIDVQGAITRRFLGMEFRKPIKETDGLLGEKLEKERGSILLKAVYAYLEFSMAHGTENIWKCKNLPDYFKKERKKLQVQINPVMSYIQEGERFDIKPQRYTLLTYMKDDCNRWLKENRYPRTVKFDHDAYISVFDELLIVVEKDVKMWNGAMMEGLFASGIGMRSSNAPDLVQGLDNMETL